MGDLNFIFGDVAQLVEHLPEEQGVVSSILTVTTESRINGKPPLPYGSQSVKLVKWGFMVVIVLMVSTSDCGSASMGSNPINYPIGSLSEWSIVQLC